MFERTSAFAFPLSYTPPPNLHHHHHHHQNTLLSPLPLVCRLYHRRIRV